MHTREFLYGLGLREAHLGMPQMPSAELLGKRPRVSAAQRSAGRQGQPLGMGNSSSKESWVYSQGRHWGALACGWSAPPKLESVYHMLSAAHT